MNFLKDLLENDPIGTFSEILLFMFVLVVIISLIAIFYDYTKNKSNTMQLLSNERALKELVEEFRSFELKFGEQKKILEDYKYILDKLNQEISRLGDSFKADSNITTAINMANEGKSIDEISATTGMSADEIEPIIKYHGKD